MQWCAGIGNFYRYAYPLINMNKSLLSFNFDISLILLNFLTLYFIKFYYCFVMMLKQILVPIKNIHSCCQRNVNSLTTHNVVKLSSIADHNTIHKYDFICVSETYLDSSVRTDDRDILINGYNIIGADHPSNDKRVGLCIYY